MRLVASLTAVLLVLLLPAVVRSDDPVSTSVTFNREIIRIFARKCLPCHTRDGVAMSLAAYREARPWARAIREELIEQRMPPWPAAPGYGEFANDIGLTARELTMILTWTDGGVPRGDIRDLPPRAAHAPEPPMPAPDLRLELPVQQVPAREEHIVRRITIDPGLASDRWIREAALVPGNKRVVRAAFVWIVPPGDRRNPSPWIGAWTPWLSRVSPPDGAIHHLPAGARLLVELHYRGRDAAAEDRSSLALSFAPRPDGPRAGQLQVQTSPASPAERYLRARGTATLSEETAVWAILPPTAAGVRERTASLEVSARRPDGTTDVLLWLPEGRFDWPTPYVLRAPIILPAGSTVAVTRAVPSDGGAPPAPSSITLATYRPAAATRSSETRQAR